MYHFPPTELSVATGEFAQNIGDLASSDVADVEQKAQNLQAIQADQDVATLMATADEYARLINSVRVRFTEKNSSGEAHDEDFILAGLQFTHSSLPLLEKR
jgi:sorting nexin-1/2